eukprot:3101493-Pyramimonas_sp.AAC.1
MLTAPWVILADWNKEPRWRGDETWLAEWQGAVLNDPECKATCDKGKGSACDCVIARADFVARLDVEVVCDVPWKNRCGVKVAAGRAGPWARKSIAVPKALPARARPGK